jgi:uncharacterized protein DUF3592
VLGRRQRPGVFRSILVVAGGVVFFIAGLVVHRSYSPYPDGLSAVGTITEIRTVRDNRDTLTHTAVYTFTTADGRTVSFEDPGSGSGRPALGTRVTVSYQAARPEAARRVPGFDWFGWSIITVGCGIGGLGLYDLVRAARRSSARSIGGSPAPPA